MPVRVYFAYTLDGAPDPVCAVFADTLGDDAPDVYTCYSHVGQHGTCSPGWVAEATRPATGTEYAPLLAELTRSGPGGYDDLAVVDTLPA